MQQALLDQALPEDGRQRQDRHLCCYHLREEHDREQKKHLTKTTIPVSTGAEMRNAVRAGFDPITVVEAAYDLGASDREWLSRLVAATAPTLDQGFGTSAALWQIPVEGVKVTALDVSTRSELLALAPVIYSAIGNNAARYYTHVPALRAASEYAGDPTVQGILRRCSAALGTTLRDIVGVCVGDGRCSGVAVTSFTAAPARFSIRQRNIFHRIALHIGAGLRLRARATSGVWCAADAVLDASGRMVHAEGDARTSTAREALANAVRAIDRARGSLRRHDPDEALTLWRALVAGKWSVVEWIDSDGRRLLVAHMNPIDAEDPRRLSGREREVAEFIEAHCVPVGEVRHHPALIRVLAAHVREPLRRGA